MSRFIILISIFALSCKTNKVPASEPDTRVLILYYDPSAVAESVKEKVTRLGTDILYEYQNLKGFAVKVKNGKEVEKIKKQIGKLKEVLSVQEDQKMQLDNATEQIENTTGE